MALTSWVVSYDVSDDAKRRAVSRILEAHGPRVLYSVFTLQGPPRHAEAVYARARRAATPTDRFLLLPRCERCRHATFGSGLEPPAGSPMVVA